MRREREWVSTNPFKRSVLRDIKTTGDRKTQLWQEFTMLRHKEDMDSTSLGKSIVAFNNQAKLYFVDGSLSNWRSSGVLYYYSFLNLAKAYILKSNGISDEVMKSSTIYHGLRAPKQDPARLVDYKITIHPPEKNVFGLFYEKLLDQKWPFSGKVNIELSQVAGYCNDISYELWEFNGIASKTCAINSYIVLENEYCWFDFVVSNEQVNLITSNLEGDFQVITEKEFTRSDKEFLKKQYAILEGMLHNFNIIRLNKEKITSSDAESQDSVEKKSYNDLRDLCIPIPSSADNDLRNSWYLGSKCRIADKDLVWHPLLSDYIFSFVLSDILRYHPYIFDKNPVDAFIAEAWCNQSSITALRYFLMAFTNPSVRLN